MRKGHGEFMQTDLDKIYGIDERYPRGDYCRHGRMDESDHEDDDALPDDGGSTRAKLARNQWTMLITTLVDAGVAEDVAIDRVANMTVGDDKWAWRHQARSHWGEA